MYQKIPISIYSHCAVWYALALTPLASLTSPYFKAAMQHTLSPRHFLVIIMYAFNVVFTVWLTRLLIQGNRKAAYLSAFMLLSQAFLQLTSTLPYTQTAWALLDLFAVACLASPSSIQFFNDLAPKKATDSA